jgi:hypothetical protein
MHHNWIAIAVAIAAGLASGCSRLSSAGGGTSPDD